MTSTITAEQVALPTGTWNIDASHSTADFTVRHAMISKVRGRFEGVSGRVEVVDDLTAARVVAEIDMASIRTGDESRDTHLRSADFFDVEQFPTMTFTSREIRPAGQDWVVVGDLNLHGVTRPVELAVEFNGVIKDPFGATRAGFSATTEINRKDFGLTWDAVLETGGVGVSDTVNVALEIQAAKV